DAAQHLEQRALAGSVSAHDAERFTAAQLEADVCENLQALEPPRTEHAEDMLAHRFPPHRRNPECLGDAFELDQRHHRYSAARGLNCRKMASPATRQIATSSARQRC